MVMDPIFTPVVFCEGYIHSVKLERFVLQCNGISQNGAAQETKSDQESTESTEGVSVFSKALSFSPHDLL